MSRSSMSTTAFLAIQLAVVAAAAGGWLALSAERHRERALPAPRLEPLAVPPFRDDPQVVSDEDLRRVLSRLTLSPHGETTNIGKVDHALRMWGAGAEFDRPGALSGEEMRHLLTDHRRFAELMGEETPPLLIDDGEGVVIRALEGTASSSHVDHTLATLAEIGTPLDHPLVTERRQTTLRSAFDESLRRFSLNQLEYEWSAVSYALLLPPVTRWITFEGQEVTFDRLARRIMREELPSGVCAGNHRLHSLVVFLRIDEMLGGDGAAGLLAPWTRSRIEFFLQEVTDALVRHQHEEGYWDRDWPRRPAASGEPGPEELEYRFIVTGHVLEWWALAPESVQPPRQVVRAAAKWLVAAIDGLSDEEIHLHFSYLSHAGRALALWRGTLPEEVGSAAG